MEPNEVMAAIGRGIELGQAGDRAGARQVFAELWDRLGPDGDALQRCGLAHSMADVQDDAREELEWDLRALAAALEVEDGSLEGAGMAGSAQGLLPSCHLNLADVHRRLGQGDEAREHVALGRAALEALPDDGYRAMIAEALDRVEAAAGGE